MYVHGSTGDALHSHLVSPNPNPHILTPTLPNQATRSTPTSVTSTRRMRIDYLLHSSQVAMDDTARMPLLTTPIPE